MFKYVSDVSMLAHNIIDRFVDDKSVAIDATLGNGYDCDYLSNRFNKVYAFDIQKESCENYNNENNNVVVINDSHHKFNEYLNEKVNCICYNLGYLPGGDKNITTIAETTILSIKYGLELLEKNGIITVAVYRGHDEGKKEESCIIEFMKKLDKRKYGVMLHECINRSSSSPVLLVIEKK